MSSDPAVNAAESAMEPINPGMYATGYLLAVRAAREALAPLRPLHQPFTVRTHDGEEWVECEQCCGRLWPCATAKLVYPAEELR